MTRSGEQLEQVAHTIRKRAPDRDARRLSDQAAERFERSGRYLQQARPQDLRSDLETAIRAHPLRSMLIGLGIGMIIGRITGGKK
jgi:ElaB/YqjD/DUF883 family membrane-anchored ribosome-binding protein